MIRHYEITDIAPYINWIYFFHAWGCSQMTPRDRQQLRQEAEQRLERYGHQYRTHALFRLMDARGEGDDIVTEGVRIPCLRQQWAGSDYLSMADFVSSKGDRVGVFATTVDAGLENDFDDDPYEKMMMQLLADRLAEATAERLHEEVRKHDWGYASDEQLTIAEMQQERFRGIRPAVGYPSLPDTSLNFVIDQLLQLSQIGIRLTESGAMKPHASVSGLMIACEQARYFTVGKIGEDQLADYAMRRGVPVELMRKFLGGNL